MTTTAQALAFALATVAAAAAATTAIGTGRADHAPKAASASIVKLERVVVFGKRVADASTPKVLIAQLPRVVIEGRRTLPANEVQLADAKPLAQAL